MAEIAVQRGTTEIAASAATATITAGSEYTAPASITKAFIRIVGINFCGDGQQTAAGGQPHRTWVVIDNPGNLLTSITFSRDLSASTTAFDITWEIWEYTGAASGPNEFVVLGQQTLTLAATAGTADSSAWTPTTDADVVAFLTGQRADDNGGSRDDVAPYLHTTEWVAASNLIRATRDNTDHASTCSVAAVEFTGSNWTVQRVTHAFSAADTNEDETPTTLADITKTMIHAQHRASDAATEEIAGFQVWVQSTTIIRFFADAVGGGHNAVAWVIENSASDFLVTRYSGTWTASVTDPDTTTVSLSPTVTLAETVVMGECGDINGGTNTDANQTMMGIQLTATNTATLSRGVSDEDRRYRFEVVEFPATAASGGMPLVGGVGLVGG